MSKDVQPRYALSTSRTSSTGRARDALSAIFAIIAIKWKGMRENIYTSNTLRASRASSTSRPRQGTPILAIITIEWQWMSQNVNSSNTLWPGRTN